MSHSGRLPNFETLSIHAGQKPHAVTGALANPVFTTTSFVFNDSAHGANIFAGRDESSFAYSRLGNPTVAVFEQRMAILEGGAAALAASSGQAAIFMAITGLASAGDNIVVSNRVSEESYAQFRHRFPTLGITARFVDTRELATVRNAIDNKTRAIFVESISSIDLEVADIESIAAVSHEVGVPLVVDNTPGAGGYLIRPIDHGADIVIHSASEWIAGPGHAVSGVIVDSGKFDWNAQAERFPHLTQPAPGYHGLNFWEKFGNKAYMLYVRMALLRDAGPCQSPFAAFNVLAGLETLSIRLDKHNSNALALAKWLDENDQVSSVVYPGLSSRSSPDQANKYLRHGHGGVLFFRPCGGPDVINAVIHKFKLALSATGTGTTQTLVARQDSITRSCGQEKEDGATYTAEAAIRVSVGLEHIDDIVDDFQQALSGF